jgi:hypothetical protein
MESEGLLLYSKQPTTCPYHKPDEPSLHFPTLFSKIHSNIILPSTAGS